MEREFHFVPLADLFTSDPPSATKRPALAVTFDDGFDLIASGVADLLERHGVSATSFVITSCLNNEALMWRHKLSAAHALSDPSRFLTAYNDIVRDEGLASISLARDAQRAASAWPTDRKDEMASELWERCELPRLEDFIAEHRPYFTDDGVREWLRRGHSIGLHTRTHPYCDTLGEDGVVDEIADPATELRHRFGIDTLWFSYPFGVRLQRRLERELFAAGVIDCALGIRGPVLAGTPPDRGERVAIDGGISYAVFGRVLFGRRGP
jgi:peptidoglycan/xylan/chitin deacetylase (PgdA/CDA1 family)